MPRNQVSDIKNIATFEKLTDNEIESFISDAATVIDSRVAVQVSQETAALIEKYLAAHLASMKEQRVAESEFGDVNMHYEGTAGMGLEHTRYGQQVLMLDQSGLLKSKNHYTTVVNNQEQLSSSTE